MTTINTPVDFANAVLSRLGAPPNSPGPLTFFTTWEAAEGGNWRNTAAFNPLNTSLQLPGSVNYQTQKPGSGVQSYQSWDQGIDATVQTLTGSDPAYGYGPIVSGLRSGATAQTLAQALRLSSWDAGRYTSGPIATLAGGGAGTAYTGASGGASTTPTASSGDHLENDGSVSYWPSVVGGVPAIPPSLNKLGDNPIGDLKSVLDFGIRWSGWALFTAMVFILGVVLFLIGLAILGVVLFGPAAGAITGASPVRAVTRTVKGRRREAREEATHQRRREERTTDREHAAAVKRSVKPVSRPLDERPFQQSERTLKARPPGRKKAA